MNSEDFKKSLEKANFLLSKSLLLKDAKYKFKVIDSRIFKFRSKRELADAYAKEVSELNFNFMLKDESFFQFHFEQLEDSKCKLRFIFFQFPYDFPNYEQFLRSEYNARFSDVGYSCHEKYSQAASEANLKKEIILFRYDYSEREYKEGTHSVSHIHLGFSDTIRFAIDKMLSPDVFTLFIIKQIYTNEWSKMIYNSKLQNELRSIKRLCPSLADYNLFNDLDRFELYLT